MYKVLGTKYQVDTRYPPRPTYRRQAGRRDTRFKIMSNSELRLKNVEVGICESYEFRSATNIKSRLPSAGRFLASRLLPLSLLGTSPACRRQVLRTTLLHFSLIFWIQENQNYVEEDGFLKKIVNKMISITINLINSYYVLNRYYSIAILLIYIE